MGSAFKILLVVAVCSQILTPLANALSYPLSIVAYFWQAFIWILYPLGYDNAIVNIALAVFLFTFMLQIVFWILKIAR